MMTRSTTSALTGRASAMRRMRRRTQFATATTGETRTFCRTNGCPSFLELDPATGRAVCPICGYTPRPH